MIRQTTPDASETIVGAQPASRRPWTQTEFLLDPRPKQQGQGEANADSVRKYFESEASFWRAIYAREDVYAVIYQDRQAAVLSQVDRLDLPAGARVLDIGCGAGLTSVSFAQRGFAVDAVDVAPAMLDQTRRLAKDSGVAENIRTWEADVRHLPFPDGTFNLVVALGVLPWVASFDGALREMERVLRTGGYLIISVDNRWRLHELVDPFAWLSRAKNRVALSLGASRRRPQTPPCRRLSIRETDALVAGAGLRKVRGATLGFGPFWLARHCLPPSFGVTVHRALQRCVDLGLPFVRSTGAHYIVLSSKTGPTPH
jgi:SAM-dependent methyltransferase